MGPSPRWPLNRWTLGPVTATIAVSPEQPVIGDLITLSIEVVAEAEVEVLMPEFGEALDRFAIIDFVPRQEVDTDGGTIARQEYRLQPAFRARSRSRRS